MNAVCVAMRSTSAMRCCTSRSSAARSEELQRIAEVERIATQTAFNGQKVLDGTFGTATFQVGANVGETISLNLSTSVRSTSIGKTADYVSGTAQYVTTSNVGQQGAGVDVTGISSGDVTIAIGTQSAVTVQASVAGAAAGQTAASAYAKTQAINASGIGGLTATADTTSQYNLGATAISATQTGYNLTINGVPVYSNYSGVASGAVTADQLVSAVNANTSATGVTASYDSVNTRITFNAVDGRNALIVQGSTTNATNGTTEGIGVKEGTNNVANAATLVNGAGASTTVTDVGTIRLTAANTITIGGATPARIGYTATSLALGNSALNSTSVTTVANANTTIGRVDAALTSVSSLRSTFGAIQNRFESTISNLQAISENLQASRSRILDTDFAAETANLTRAQILQQAGVAILAQANAAPQSVLGLLR